MEMRRRFYSFSGHSSAANADLWICHTDKFRRSVIMATLNAKSIPNAFEMVEGNNKEEDKVKEKRSRQDLGPTMKLPLLILRRGEVSHNFQRLS